MSDLRVTTGRTGRVVRSTSDDIGTEIEHISKRYLNNVLLEFDPGDDVVRGYVKVVRQHDEQFYAEYYYDDETDPITAFRERVEDEISDADWRIDKGGGTNQAVFDSIGSAQSQSPTDIEDATIAELLSQGRQIGFEVPDGEQAIGLMEYLRTNREISDQLKYVVTAGNVPEWLEDFDVAITINPDSSEVRAGWRTHWYLEDDKITDAEEEVVSAFNSLYDSGYSPRRIARQVNTLGVSNWLDASLKPSDERVTLDAFLRYSASTLLLALIVGMPAIVYLARGEINDLLTYQLTIADSFEPILATVGLGTVYPNWVYLSTALLVTVGTLWNFPPFSSRRNKVASAIKRTIAEIASLPRSSESPAASEETRSFGAAVETFATRIDESEYRYGDGGRDKAVEQLNDLVEEFGFEFIATGSVSKRHRQGALVGVLVAGTASILVYYLLWRALEPLFNILVSDTVIVITTHLVIALAGAAVVIRLGAFMLGALRSPESQTVQKNGRDGTYDVSVEQGPLREEYRVDRKRLKQQRNKKDWRGIRGNLDRYLRWLDADVAMTIAPGDEESCQSGRQDIANTLLNAHYASRMDLLSDEQLSRVKSISPRGSIEDGSASERSDTHPSTSTARSQQQPERTNPSSDKYSESRESLTQDSATSESSGTDDGSPWGEESTVVSEDDGDSSNPSREGQTDRSRGEDIASGSESGTSDNSKHQDDAVSGGTGPFIPADTSTLGTYSQYRASAGNTGFIDVSSPIEQMPATAERPHPNPTFPPVLTRDVVLLADRNGNILTYKRRDGKKHWTSDKHRYVSQPIAVTTERVFVPTGTGTIQSIAVEDGSTNAQQRINLKGDCTSPPTVTGDSVYACCSKGSLYRFTHDGEHRWNYDAGSDATDSAPTLVGPPAVDEVIAVGLAGHGDAIEVVDLHGSRIQTHGIDARPIGPPVVDGRIVYACDEQGTVYRLDDGTNWQTTVSQPQHGLAVGQSQVYVPASSGICALDKQTGQKQWRESLPANPACTPIVDRNMVYICDESNTLHALDADSGNRQWKTSGAYQGEFAVCGNKIVASTTDGFTILTPSN
jgi:outer membrane protein assembly factor BamB